ncbi:hypothetical protein [Bacteriovorax sp. DB6_IX]|uniref:hypothetical protein n=1 Tax=Bacteriovorax sp. DB6_IX TaxID=1353530 RepID=UPI00038A3BAF|nr:hypothetical protein [Bacteriovorax sp. DB6_IX]EQC48730.1 hypothetical protein M901_0092 [Bacteriovorax sp. DB6_IX]
MKKCIFLAAMMTCFGVSAGNISGPIGLPGAKTLPKGVRNLSIKGVFAQGLEKYDGNGNSVSLADPFFQNLSFGNILSGTEDPKKQGEILAAMNKVGANESDSFGSATGQVNLDATVTVPVFAWGLTSKLTAAIAVPIIKTSLNVDTGVIHNNSSLYNQVVNELGYAPEKQEEFQDKMNSPVSEKLKEYGYKALRNEDETKLGDIKLVTKYKTFENKLNSVVVTGELTLPTGREEDLNKIVDLPGGDGQTDFGLSVNYDYYPMNWLTLSSQVSHTVQFADKQAKRVPFWRGSKLTPYIDENVDRDLGDLSSVQLAAQAKYLGFGFGTNYALQYKGGDKYTGTKFEKSWYDNIGKDTIQRMGSFTFSASYDTISLFRQKKFPVPLSLSVSHSVISSGKNVVKDPITALDFTMFF